MANKGKEVAEIGSNNDSASFPSGLRVLLVDDDPICLKVVETMLRLNSYEVISVDEGLNALTVLRETKGAFDLVITDVHMPMMDGFALMEHIIREFKIPVIMMSADDKFKVVTRGLELGACFYLFKPLTLADVQNLWQHVVRKRKEYTLENNSACVHPSPPRDRDNTMREDTASSFHHDNSSMRDIQRGDNSSQRRMPRDVKHPRDDDHKHGKDNKPSTSQKKPRVVWTPLLHDQFLEAIDTLGIEKAVPKKILELMSVPGLTRENVASHLQKYRLFIKRLRDASRSMDPRSPRCLTGSILGFGISRPTLLQLQQGLLPQLQGQQRSSWLHNSGRSNANQTGPVRLTLPSSITTNNVTQSRLAALSAAPTNTGIINSNPNPNTTGIQQQAWMNNNNLQSQYGSEQQPRQVGANTGGTSMVFSSRGSDLVQAVNNYNMQQSRGRPPYSSTFGPSASANRMLTANSVPPAYNGGNGRFMTQGPAGFNNPNSGASNYTGLMVNNNGGVLIGGMNGNRAGDGGTSFGYGRMEEELNRANRAPAIGGSGGSNENARNNSMIRISAYDETKGKGIMMDSSNELTGSAPPTFPINVAAPVEKPQPQPQPEPQQNVAAEVDSWLHLLRGNSATESEFDQYLYAGGQDQNPPANQGDEEMLDTDFNLGDYQLEENNPGPGTGM
ncbi:hypothetical protein Scep_006476 [Stephania cephalantha]|uniref:Two-component response regulator n=1 Tax=Stephania cephalantha TaxID=152367 RepID=A0AAP0K9L5_9MAGN